LFINNIRNRKPLPVYGNGENVRDWLYVEDHARAIETIFHNGKIAETYNIGGFNEWKNIDIIHTVIKTVDRLLGREEGADLDLITYVTDRLGLMPVTLSTAPSCRENLVGSHLFSLRKVLRRLLDGILTTRSGWITLPRVSMRSITKTCTKDVKHYHGRR
jgi:dTDP-D-glucose 4,6-dehydratase